MEYLSGIMEYLMKSVVKKQQSACNKKSLIPGQTHETVTFFLGHFLSGIKIFSRRNSAFLIFFLVAGLRFLEFLNSL